MEKELLMSQSQLKGDFPDVKPGATVRVHQRIKEGDKERTQAFEGVVLSRKHGKGIGATIIVRKVVEGIGVERVFPLHAPTLEKIEVVRQGKVRRSKLYYLRKRSRKAARMQTVAATSEKATE